MKIIITLLVVFFVMLQMSNADIYCNDKGICTGGGRAAEDTRCGNCHSCTYKNCCHVRFTNPHTKCNIPGWRSETYKTVNG